jgi:hypothetical protein
VRGSWGTVRQGGDLVSVIWYFLPLWFYSNEKTSLKFSSVKT